jgi:MFS/sugar transport protein
LTIKALFLLIYYTNVVGLNPALIATMFLVVRAWDAFADLVAGRMVDITRSRWGKFRPYLLFASLPLLLSSIALVQRPELRSYDRQIHLRVHHLCAAGLPLLLDQHPVRFPGYCNDLGSCRAFPPWYLAHCRTDHRHFHPRIGDRAFDHEAPDSA